MKPNYIAPLLFTLSSLLTTLPLDFIASRKNYYRVSYTIAPPVTTCEEGSNNPQTDGIFLCSFGDARGNGLHVCTQYEHCPEGPDGRFETIDVCPNSEEEWVDKLVTQGASWEPPIDKNEAYRALHAVDPRMFPHADWDAKLAVDDKSVGPTYISLSQAQHMGALGIPPPGPVKDGVEMNCKKWHEAVAKDSCYRIAENNVIPLQQFYDWNKEVNNGGQCMGLWIGYSYCVGT